MFADPRRATPSASSSRTALSTPSPAVVTASANPEKDSKERESLKEKEKDREERGDPRDEKKKDEKKDRKQPATVEATQPAPIRSRSHDRSSSTAGSAAQSARSVISTPAILAPGSGGTNNKQEDRAREAARASLLNGAPSAAVAQGSTRERERERERLDDDPSISTSGGRNKRERERDRSVVALSTSESKSEGPKRLKGDEHVAAASVSSAAVVEVGASIGRDDPGCASNKYRCIFLMSLCSY